MLIIINSPFSGKFFISNPARNNSSSVIGKEEHRRPILANALEYSSERECPLSAITALLRIHRISRRVFEEARKGVRDSIVWKGNSGESDAN